MRAKDIDTRIAQALQLGQGDRQAAIRTLIGWCATDHRLLVALIQPYLQGILFHHVERVAGAASGDRPPPTRKAKLVPEALPNAAMDAIVDQLGSRIPNPPRPARAAPRTPEEQIASLGRSTEPPPPPAAGKQHRAAMQVVARSFKQVDWKR